MQVVGGGGRVFGRVDEIEIDAGAWKVESLVVRVTSDAISALGINKPFWTHAQVVIPVSAVQAVSDVVVLRLTIDEFGQRLLTAREHIEPTSPATADATSPTSSRGAPTKTPSS
ncbi:MAG: PRC-barrel domain containing protein [Deltaproteobacteria bacterium]|nr:PRC-barrel domain containing protein [Deltaproteobacteria bacterium]